ncbi:MAG TPA: hypothetical protein VN175_15540 [Rhizomicrobium sp.]|nr:hypothetical protein [Rhizomicrobium sp.]
MSKLAVSVCFSLLMMGAAAAQPTCPAAASGASVTSATASPELEPARLMQEQAATVTLHPVGEVRFVRTPERRLDASSYGGMVAVDVREAGTYQVSLSAGAWIDVLKDGAEVASTAHEHGAGCSGFAKTVSFPLQPGRHVIQLSGNKEDTITVMVARK